MDEARTVIRRLERIEALQREDAPAGELLAEVRKLLRDGEAWIAAERESRDREAIEDGEPATENAAAALAGCREIVASREEVSAQTA